MASGKILIRGTLIDGNGGPPVRDGAILIEGAGREEEARAEGAEVLRISPNFSLEAWRQILPYKDQAEVEHYLDGLRKAGLK